MYEGYFFRGYAKYELGDYTGAEHDYTKAISLFPFLVDIYRYRAITRDQLSDYTGALEDYDQAISIDSNVADIYINRANTFLSLYRFRAAIDDCDRAEKLKYTDVNLYGIRASAEASLKDYKAAILDYTKAVKKNPKNTIALVQRGSAYYADGQKDSAMQDYNRALKEDSLNSYALFERAMVEVDDSDMRQAMLDLNRVIELSPNCAVALFNRAIIYSNNNRLEQALDDYNAIVAIDPNSILTYFNRADLKLEMHDMKGALKDYDKAIELCPDFAKAYYYRSQVKKEMGNFKGANADDAKAKKIENAKSLLPDSSRYMEEIRLMKMTALPDDFSTPEDAKNLIQYKDVDIEPRTIFAVVLRLDTGEIVKVYQPREVQGRAAKPVLLVNKASVPNDKMVLKKITALDSVLRKNSKDTIAYLNRGILYTSLQLYQQAFADYDMAIALAPANGLAYFCRGNARYKYLEFLESMQGEDVIPADSTTQKNTLKHKANDVTYEMVIADYTHSIQLDSNFSYGWYNRSEAEFQLHDLTRALKDLSVALNCDTTIAEAYYNTGLLLVLFKDIPHACEYLSRAGEQGILESYNVIKRYCYKPKME